MQGGGVNCGGLAHSMLNLLISAIIAARWFQVPPLWVLGSEDDQDVDNEDDDADANAADVAIYQLSS